MRKRNVPGKIRPLHERAEKALKVAVKKAIQEHLAAGVPAFIWRDGKVVRYSGSSSKRGPGKT